MRDIVTMKYSLYICSIYIRSMDYCSILYAATVYVFIYMYICQYSLVVHVICICTSVNENVTWLILPVVICLSQRLSHACLSINVFDTVKLRTAHYISDD